MKTNKTTYQGSWTFSTASTSGFWKYYETRGTDMSEFNQFAAIFDEYKITNLKYTFRPRYTGYDVQDTAVGSFPVCTAHVIKDPGSTKIPSGAYNVTTINEFLENGSVKSYTLNRPFNVSFRPKILGDALGGSTSALPESSKWIRTTDDAVTHRGFHMFLQNSNMNPTNVTVLLDVFVTYTVQFRGAR
jgi:hypothetical protein